MAQLNITLDQKEILQLLTDSRPDAFREILQTGLNRILQAESSEQLKAEKYERTEERTDSRNGSRERELQTRLGRITLNVPRHRNQPFKTLIFENYSRSERALITTMAEMVVEGVSTRKISNVMETLCDTPFSKSTVSEVCKALDKDVRAFRERPLENIYPFVFLDATYFKNREKHRIISKAFLIALGATADGSREILGFGVYPNESRNTWKDFLDSLKSRGLDDVLMFTSDAHEGIIKALSQVFPESPWQRCQTHFSRNILTHVPKQYQAAIQAELHIMYNCSTIEAARKKRDEIIAEYQDLAEKAMQCLEEGFESAMMVMFLPSTIRKLFRTSNHLERVNRELKRRSKVIGIFPNEASILRLMGSVLLEIHNRYSALNSLTISWKIGESLPSLSDSLKKAAAEEYQLLLMA